MPENPYRPPKEVREPAEVSLPVRLLLPWPTLGYWLLAFFLPMLMSLAGYIDHAMDLHWLDRPGTIGSAYVVLLVPLALCWIVTLTAKTAVSTKVCWFILTPILLAAQIGLLVLIFVFVFARIGPNGIQP